MECSEIIYPAIALKIIQNQDNRLLKEKLFDCIYSLFHDHFLQWILKRYNSSKYKDKLWKDAEDAFQEGISAFYFKARKGEVDINGSIKTTIYSFGLLQLLARFKKEKIIYEDIDHTEGFNLLFEADILEKERLEILDEREHELMQAMSKLPVKQREILIMKFFGKLRSKQIAEKMGITAGDVDNNAAKAYKELRRIMQPAFTIQKEKQ